MSGLMPGMGILIFLLDFQRSTVRLEGGLIRNPYGKGKRVEELRAALEGGESADLTVEVSEQAYDGAGLQELFHRSTALLEREILGENQSLDRIEQDMDLVTEIPGEPVDVSWELDRYDVMNVYGELQEEALSPEGTLVNLKAVLTYQEDETRQALYECTAMVYPRTLGEEEARQKNLEQEIRDRDKETQTREELRLPDEVDGEGVRYYPRLDIRGLVIMGMALMTGFLLLAKEKQDLLKEQQKRKEQMIRDYPEIISKLTLFLGAGMTVKRAWKKIITDYETKGKARGERYIYEEMIRTAREMDSGVMESESYERFRQALPGSGVHAAWSTFVPELKKRDQGTDTDAADGGDPGIRGAKSPGKKTGRGGRDQAPGAYVPYAGGGAGDRDRAGISVHPVIERERRELMWRLRYFMQTLKEEKGIGVVEVILILVVLIGLVIIFKSQLTSLVQTIFQKITSESAGI